MQTLAKVLCGATAAHVHVLKAEVGYQEVKTKGDQQNPEGGEEHNPKTDKAHPEHLTPRGKHSNQYVAYKICATSEIVEHVGRCRLSTT
jgi:hypothetical protein